MKFSLPRLVFVAAAGLMACPGSLSAQTFVFNGTTPGTYQWGTGAGWDAVPVSGSSTVLTIFDPNTTELPDGTVTLNNNLGTFQLNRLNLQGTGPATSGTANIVISGNRLSFASNGGVGPVVDYSSVNPSGSRVVRYTISSNVELLDDTTFTGSNNGNLTLSGTLSGPGNMIVQRSLSVFGSNLGRVFSGDILVEGGSFTLGDNATSSRLYTAGNFHQSNTGEMNIEWRTSELSVLAFTSNATQIIGAGRIFVNDADTASKSLNATFFQGGKLLYYGAGTYAVKPLDGNNGGASGYGKLYVGGVGTLTTTGVTADYSGTRAQLAPNIYGKGTLVITGTTGGNMLGGGHSGLGLDVPLGDGLYMYGGVLRMAPTGSNRNIFATGLAVTGSMPLRLRGGAEIQLDKGNNTSLTLALGREGLAYGYNVIERSRAGTLTVAASGGFAELGVSEKLLVQGSGSALPTVTNGMVLPYFVGQDTDGQAGFLTYGGTGIATDTGFQAASSSGTTLSGATTTSVVHVSSSESVDVDTSVYALRNDSTVTIEAGRTLTVGTGAHAGLILNGGRVEGGTLAFEDREALIYTNGAGGEISSTISGAGAAVDGITGFVSLTKFGEGTLVLSGDLTYTGQTVINQGALRVDPGALPSGALLLRGGVLETNGTFTRAVGAPGTENTVNFSIDSNDAGGGFAAHGGALTVNLGGSGATLTWSSANFVRDTGLLSFGSLTANDVVDWQNGLNLGATSGAYFRQIYVEDNPDSDADYAIISGTISDAGNVGLHGLQKVGPGTLVLTANNTYSGITAVSSGTLSLGNGGASGSVAGDIHVYDTLAFHRSDAVTYSQEISKSGRIVQVGAGTTTLTGENTYAGGTEVNAGTLLISNTQGSGAGSGDVVVNAGGTLGGTGTFTGALIVNEGGVLAPGASVETLGSGSLFLNEGSTFAYEVDSSVALAVGADLQKVSGNLELDGVVNLVWNDLAASPELFDLGTTFTLINYTGTWNGGVFTFEGSEILNGGIFTAGLNTWRIDYDAGAGGVNFSGEYLGGSYVNVTAVPEPTATLLLTVGVAVLTLTRRTRWRRIASATR
jgi:autotransporter-associated beta strand protein